EPLPRLGEQLLPGDLLFVAHGTRSLASATPLTAPLFEPGASGLRRPRGARPRRTPTTNSRRLPRARPAPAPHDPTPGAPGFVRVSRGGRPRCPSRTTPARGSAPGTTARVPRPPRPDPNGVQRAAASPRPPPRPRPCR